MAKIDVRVLSDQEIQSIHDTALVILRNTGVRVRHDGMLKLLAESGARVEFSSQIARLPEAIVMDCISRAGKKYILYGRDPRRIARFGHGDLVLMSSPGQFG